MYHSHQALRVPTLSLHAHRQAVSAVRRPALTLRFPIRQAALRAHRVSAVRQARIARLLRVHSAAAAAAFQAHALAALALRLRPVASPLRRVRSAVRPALRASLRPVAVAHALAASVRRPARRPSVPLYPVQAARPVQALLLRHITW